MKSLRLLSAIILAVAFTALPALAQQTRAQIAAEIAANLPDNSSGAITPAVLRTTLSDISLAAPNTADGDVTAAITAAFAASPVFGGIPTTPTASLGDNTTQVASTAFVIANASAGSGTVTHTAGNLTVNQLVIGNAAADLKVLGSLGTTTQVLHGNASGAPTFAAVSLTADVSGILPVANGGTATASPALVAGTNVTITGTWPNQTINSSGGGSVAWGAITGTLASQTDLNTALGLKATIASPTFTGVPAAPTAAAGTNTTQLATTAGIVAERTATATLTGKTMSGASNTFSALPAAGITGVIPIANLATGTPTGTKFIKDDGTLAVPAGSGTGDLLSTNNLSDVASASSSLKNLRAVGTYYYSIYDYASGSQLTGGADATASLQNALNAIETAMKANDGGRYILDLRDAILRIDGPLVSTNSNNAQITLPALDVYTDPQCTLVIRGSAPVAMSFSVIGTVAIPTKGAIIRSTLTTGGGTLPAVIAGRAPTGASWAFTSITVVFENIEIQTVPNPFIGGLNCGLVNELEMQNSVVSTGIYTVADVTTPTHSDAIAVTGPGNGNGVNNHYHNVGVIGFYTGFKLNEHASGDVMAFGCLTAVEVTQMNNSSNLDHIVSAHCVTTLRATGGVSFLVVDQLDIEHAASGPFSPGNDIEDANNYLSGKTKYAAVLAGVGPSTVFAKNGGVNFECTYFSTNVVPVWSTLSGTTPAITFLPTPQVRTITLSGNTTFSASGMAQGETYRIFITCDGTGRNLTFPAWTWLEGTPASIAASKVMQVDLTCTSTTAGSVVAVYGVQQ